MNKLHLFQIELDSYSKNQTTMYIQEIILVFLVYRLCKLYSNTIKALSMDFTFMSVLCVKIVSSHHISRQMRLEIFTDTIFAIFAHKPGSIT